MKNVLSVLFILLCNASVAQWSLQTTMPVGLNDVFFVQADTGFVCGQNGTLAKTVNGGINWTYLSTGTTQNLDGLFFLNADTGWVCGYKSTILKTVNGGATWQQQHYSPGGTILHDIFFVDKNIGYCAGEGATLLKTTNGGSNWTSIITSSPNGRVAVFFTAADTGYVCGIGFADAITKTTDGGASWSNVYSSSVEEFSSVWCTTDSIAFFCSSITGQIRATRNAGANWTSYTPVGNPLYDIMFPDAQHGYAVGGTSTTGIITHTTDGGFTWSPQACPVAGRISALYFADTLTGYAVSASGSIIKTTNGGIIGTAEINQQQTLSVFPNPSSEFFTIRAEDLLQGAQITLYDYTGKIIYTEHVTSGKSNLNINWNNTPGGIYLLELKTAEKCSVVRVVKE